MAKRGRPIESELRKVIKAAAAKVAVDMQNASTKTSRVQRAAADLKKAVATTRSPKGRAILGGFATSERELFYQLRDQRKQQKLSAILWRRAERAYFHRVLKRFSRAKKRVRSES